MTHVAKIRKFVADERGVTAIEYGVIAAGIAVVIITAAQAAGQAVNVFYQLAAALF